jgi:hypothetical protein
MTIRLTALGVALVLLPTPAPAQDASLVGAWQPHAYVLESGTRHAVDGLIFFTETDWSVLFFVTVDGQPRRGSAEGGTYETDGDELIFTHRFHLSVGDEMEGLPASALRMDLQSPGEGNLEESTYRVDADTMTLFFPSGNRMEFTRSSSF